MSAGVQYSGDTSVDAMGHAPLLCNGSGAVECSVSLAVDAAPVASTNSSCSVAMAQRLVGLPSTPGGLRSEIASFARYPGGGVAEVTCVEVTGRALDLEFNVASGGSAGYAYWTVYGRLPSGWQLAGAFGR